MRELTIDEMDMVSGGVNWCGLLEVGLVGFSAALLAIGGAAFGGPFGGAAGAVVGGLIGEGEYQLVQAAGICTG